MIMMEGSGSLLIELLLVARFSDPVLVLCSKSAMENKNLKLFHKVYTPLIHVPDVGPAC